MSVSPSDQCRSSRQRDVRRNPTTGRTSVENHYLGEVSMPKCIAASVACLGAAAVLALPGAAAGQVESQDFHLLANVPQVVDPSQPAPHFQSDEAFWGDRAYVGNYDGFRIFDISDPGSPQLLSDFRCRAQQNDISVWQNRLVFLSVDRPQVQPPGQPRGVC